MASDTAVAAHTSIAPTPAPPGPRAVPRFRNRTFRALVTDAPESKRSLRGVVVDLLAGAQSNRNW